MDFWDALHAMSTGSAMANNGTSAFLNVLHIIDWFTGR